MVVADSPLLCFAVVVVQSTGAAALRHGGLRPQELRMHRQSRFAFRRVCVSVSLYVVYAVYVVHGEWMIVRIGCSLPPPTTAALDLCVRVCVCVYVCIYL